jgi:thiol-disulfide isomerase/thioredoxin
VTHDVQSDKGSLREDQAQLMFGDGFSFSGYERDVLFLGLDGKSFLDISGVSGADSVLDGRGGVFADFDNDGDLDIFITNIQADAHQLFRNNVGQDSGFVRVIVDGGRRYGRDAFGTVVRAPSGRRTLTKIKTGGSGYLSQHDPRLLFAVAAGESLPALDVTWPDGRIERFEGPFAAGSTVGVRPGRGRPSSITLTRGRLPEPLGRNEAAARSLTIERGRRLPEFAVERIEGGSAAPFTTLLRPGRRTLVNVWATWCGPCLKEMRELEALRTTLAAGGIDIVGLNVDTDPHGDPRGFVRRTGARYPIALGGIAAVSALYRSDELTVPLSVLLDDEGRVEEIFSGWSGAVRSRLLDLAGPRETPR